MALNTFRFEASFPAHPDYLEPLGELVHAIVVYAGLPAADADALAAEIRGSLMASLTEAAGGGPVVIDFSRAGSELTLEIAAPHHAGLRIVKPVPTSS
jgi:hypothetical protein